jgi:hypothetical protein
MAGYAGQAPVGDAGAQGGMTPDVRSNDEARSNGLHGNDVVREMDRSPTRNGELSTSPLNPHAHAYYGRGYVSHAGNVPNHSNVRVSAAPLGNLTVASDPGAGSDLGGAGGGFVPASFDPQQLASGILRGRRSVHSRLGLVNVAISQEAATADLTSLLSAAGFVPDTDPMAAAGFVPPDHIDPAFAGLPDLDVFPQQTAPPTHVDAAIAFADTLLDSTRSNVANTNAQDVRLLTETMTRYMAESQQQIGVMRQQISQLGMLGQLNGQAPALPVPPAASVAPFAPVRPVAQHVGAAPAVPQFAPYVAAPVGGPASQPYVSVAPAGPPPPAPPAPPVYVYQQTAFAPQPSYYNPFSGGCAAPAPAGVPFPRTGFHPGPSRAAPQLASTSVFPSSFASPSADAFVPVQPAKPLLIDDFLSVNALHALKVAPHKLMIDPSGGGIFVQPDMSGVSSKKTKCPDLSAWLKAFEKIKAALLALGAIRGPDYDRYVDSCMTLLLDPKCGGNGWGFEIFLEFDNAHRIRQWSTGAAFDVICPMRMAHFAAMAAHAKLSASPSFPYSGAGQRRPRATASGASRGSVGKGRCYNYHNHGQCARSVSCPWATTHSCKYCFDARPHAPATCSSNPNNGPREPPAPGTGRNHAGS